VADQAPDHQAREFAAAFRDFLDWIHVAGAGEGNEVSALVRDFLEPDGAHHSVVTRDLPPFEQVNLQTAVDAWSASAGRTVEVRGIALPPHYGGGTLQPATKLQADKGELADFSPDLLPDGKSFLARKQREKHGSSWIAQF